MQLLGDRSAIKDSDDKKSISSSRSTMDRASGGVWGGIVAFLTFTIRVYLSEGQGICSRLELVPVPEMLRYNNLEFMVNLHHGNMNMICVGEAHEKRTVSAAENTTKPSKTW